MNDAWITTAFHGELEAAYSNHIKTVVVQDKNRHLSIHLTPERARVLASDLHDAYMEALEADK